MSTSDINGASETPQATSPSTGQDAGARQLEILIDAARVIANSAGTTGRTTVSIAPKPAEYLQRIQYELLDDITRLAIRRTQMRNYENLEIDDINWAWARLVVGKRKSIWTTTFITLGALLAGAGIPILLGPLVTNTDMTAGGVLCGILLTLPGLVMLSVALTQSALRR